MTEDEAKEKWCPFVRQSATFSEGYGFSYNRAMIDNAPESRCIGSACMAWRTSEKLLGHNMDYHKHYPRTDEQAQRSYDEFHRQNPLKGYCGLAGQP